MKPSEKDLVRVHSESELRGGVWFYVNTYRGWDWFLLNGTGRVKRCDALRCRQDRAGWNIFSDYAAWACGDCIAESIREGLLFRLRDEEPQKTTETEKRREVTA